MSRFLTFDCYDTLVQYSAGKNACIAALAGRQRADADVCSIIAAQGKAEKALHLGPFKPLREVLRLSLESAFKKHDLDYSEVMGEAFEHAVRFAVPFADTAAVLAKLSQRFRLVIISNSEPDIIADNMAAIGVPFHRAVTAGESKAYKPDHAMFAYVLKVLECGPQDLIHIAAGFYHDIEPAHALGWRRVWINRNGAEGNEHFGPYDELPGLRGLPELLGV